MPWLWARAIESDRAWIESAELPHLRTLRRKPGDAVRLTDGRGTRAEGTWAGDDLVTDLSIETVPPPDLELVLALGSRQTNEESVRRAAEQGVAAVHLVMAARSASAGAKPDRIDIERLRRIAKSGCSQSGNPWLPRVQPPRLMSETLEELGRHDVVCLVPEAEQLLAAFDSVRYLAVGPEGGWTEDEISGCKHARLGPFVLRSHVATAVALGQLHAGVQ